MSICVYVYIYVHVQYVYYYNSSPTFNFLSDLGVREASALLFFERFAVAIEPVILASLLVWIINLLIPTLLSLVFVSKLRFIR